MEQDTPTHGGRTAVLRSGPLRLALIISLTAVAVFAPLFSAVRTTDAQTTSTPPDAAALAEPVPTAPVPEAPVPTPAAPEPEVVGNQAVTTAPVEPVRAAPIVVVGPDQAAATTAPAIDQNDTSCLLIDEPEEEAAPSWFLDNFDTIGSSWRPLAGSWSVDNGAYFQSNSDGYDLITELVVPLPANASISVDMMAQGGALGGGLMVGQPEPMNRNGATIVDFTNEGRFLRWGIYEAETGVYQYQGGIAMTADFDAAAEHTLTLELQPERTRVLLDDAFIGTFDPVEPGQVGLVTSASAVAFDNMIVRDLDEGATNGN